MGHNGRYCCCAEPQLNYYSKVKSNGMKVIELLPLGIAAILLLCAVLFVGWLLKIIKRLFCTHKFCSTGIDRGAGMFGFIREYEWKCKKCGKTEYTEYENVGPLEYVD